MLIEFECYCKGLEGLSKGLRRLNYFDSEIGLQYTLDYYYNSNNS